MTLGAPKPNSLLSRLEIAGHPWHGLVENGTLSLPNDQSMTYRQPGASPPYMSGAARITQRAAPPAITRSAEQQAADTAQGAQWLDYAILSGGDAQLYRAALGAGAWVYHAPDASRWSVTTTLHGASAAIAGSNVTVTVRRFGEFGAALEEYAYTVAVPSDIGQATPEIVTPPSEVITPGALTIRLNDSHPQGASALFAIDYDCGNPTASRLRAVGWLTMAISGPADSATIGIAVARTRQQCLGVTGDDDAEPAATAPVYRLEFDVSVSGAIGTPPNCGSTVTTETPKIVYYAQDPAEGTRGIVDVIEGTQRKNYTGLVLALFYRANGSIGEITYDQEWECVFDAPLPTVQALASTVTTRNYVEDGGFCVEDSSSVGSQYHVRMTRTASAVTSITMRWRVDGVEQMAVTYSRTDSVSATLDLQNPPAGFTQSSADQITCTPGAVVSSTTPTAPVDSLFSTHIRPRRFSAFVVSNTEATRFAEMGVYFPVQWIFEPDAFGQLLVHPARNAPAVFGALEVATLNSALSTDVIPTYLQGAVSPSGFFAAPAIVDDGSNGSVNAHRYLYGTHHPVTGEVARSFNPVCWV